MATEASIKCKVYVHFLYNPNMRFNNLFRRIIKHVRVVSKKAGMLNSGTTNRSPIIALTIVLKGTIYSGAQMTIVTYCNIGNPVM